MKSVKKIAKVALPIAASFIPGVGPLMSAALVAGGGVLGSKIAGDSWGDALKFGALSGLGAGIAPIAGNAFAGAFPETAGALGISGGANTVFGQGFGGLSGALSGAPEVGASLAGLSGSVAPDAMGALGSASQGLASASYNPASAFGGLGSAASSAAPAVVASESGIGGLLSNAISGFKNNPIGQIGALMAVSNALGEGSQEEQLQKQQAQQQAATQQFNQQTIDMLNNAQSGRSPITPSITDYYTYGQRPEMKFFDKINTPITYG